MAATISPRLDQDLSPPVSRRRMLAMIVTGLLVSTFVSDSRHAKLPLQFLLKNHLHLGPTAMAAFFGLTSLAWYFKPVAGLLSDVVPLWGSRRRNYLVLSGLGAGLLWTTLAFVPRHYAPLVWTLVGANAFAVLASSVTGGLLVEVRASSRGGPDGWGRCARRSSPGRSSSPSRSATTSSASRLRLDLRDRRGAVLWPGSDDAAFAA